MNRQFARRDSEPALTPGAVAAPRVFELRDYSLHPGRRDDLIDLFEREFIESQEALGSRVVATFRCLDDPDRFVWLRGFADWATRFSALDGFYTSAVWRAHRDGANATIADSDNVLLLRQTAGTLPADPAARPPLGARDIPPSVIVATTYFPQPGAGADFAAFFARELDPLLAAHGAQPLASFTTARGANNYPRLPVRENESVFISLVRFRSLTACAAHETTLRALTVWRAAEQAIMQRVVAPAETMRLQPTARSLLR